MAKRLSPTDMLFLYSESRETMNHVASMLPFTPPADAPPDWMRTLVNEIREDPKLFQPRQNEHHFLAGKAEFFRTWFHTA